MHTLYLVTLDCCLVNRALTASCDWLQGMRTVAFHLLTLACFHGANGLFHDGCIGNLRYLQAGLLNKDLLQGAPMRLLGPVIKMVRPEVVDALLRTCTV
jgi:hypothetical protein